MPLLRLIRSRSSCVLRVAAIWLRHVQFAVPVSKPAPRSRMTVPRCVCVGLSLLDRSLFRVPSTDVHLKPFGSKSSAWVSSLLATSPGVSTRREGCHAFTTFRPQAFSASRRFTPHLALRAYFIPQPRTGETCSGASHSAQRSSSSEVPTPLPLARQTLGNQSYRPNPSGLDFEVLVRAESRFVQADYSSS